jgi:hypothetical protein
LNGVKIAPLVYAGVQYHIFHPLRPPTPTYLYLFDEVKTKKITKTDYGVTHISRQEMTQL